MASEDHHGRPSHGTPLRRGWTTGACATAATKAALTAILTERFPDPVTILLPKGQTPSFPLAEEHLGENEASAAIIKDAGDDPDVTHGATVRATVSRLALGSGIVFAAGPGVGMVTKPGLPIPPGEPAINPVPRDMMRGVVRELCETHGVTPDWRIEISIDGGMELAAKTWNPRLGIVGGLSILGTTGVVNPFSCASWIHSIHRGVDVARAAKLERIIAATGSTSEASARHLYPHVPEIGLIDMGDFAGGLLKYLREHPVPKVTIAGGFAKITKLAQGALDLHSARSQVDLSTLAALSETEAVAERIAAANTAAEALSIAHEEGLDLADRVARDALNTARSTLRNAPVHVEIIVTDRAGTVVARAQQ